MLLVVLKKKQESATYIDIKWKPFQLQIIDHIATEADGRTLNWHHEPTGNIGKSDLTST